MAQGYTPTCLTSRCARHGTAARALPHPAHDRRRCCSCAQREGLPTYMYLELSTSVRRRLMLIPHLLCAAGEPNV